MIFESVQFSKNQVWAYNAYLAAQHFAPVCQFIIQSARRHPLRLQRYNKIINCARFLAKKMW